MGDDTTAETVSEQVAAFESATGRTVAEVRCRLGDERVDWQAVITLEPGERRGNWIIGYGATVAAAVDDATVTYLEERGMG